MARNISNLVDVLLDRGKFTRTEAIAIAVASIVFSLVFCYPLALHLRIHSTINDWDQIGASQWAAYWTVHQYHQFPLWNPFECGGLPLLGDPQSHFVTPWFILTLIFGPVLGLHIEVLIYDAIAWSGGYVLGRVLGLRRISAICTATAFAGSSWFFLHVSEGHIPLMTFVYLPGIIAAGWAASERGKLRYAALCGALMAFCILEGNPIPPLFGGLTLALVLAGRAATQLTARPLLALMIAAVFTVGFSAVKGLPAAQVMMSNPRPTDAAFSSSDYALREALLSRNQDRNRASLNGWGFWELGAYVGLFAWIAMAALRYPRFALPWVVTAIFLFYVARGWHGDECLWVWLHRLPLFSSTRLPWRSLMPFTLMVGVVAGIGIDAVCSRGSHAAFAVSAFLIIAGGADLLMVGPPNLNYLSSGAVDSGPPRSDFVQYFRGFYPESLVIQHHSGVVDCYVYAPWPTEAKGFNQPGYRGEQYLLGPGSVTLASWSPNRLEYAVDAPGPSVLVVNQNYDPSWRVMSGPGQTFSWNGLLAVVRVPAGKSRIVLRYIGIAAICGMIISMLTAFAAFVLIRWGSRRQPRDA